MFRKSVMLLFIVLVFGLFVVIKFSIFVLVVVREVIVRSIRINSKLSVLIS